METFSALLTICAGNSPVTSEFPTQRPVTRSFDVFFDLRLNKRLSKQSRGWWFETPSCPLWCHCNVCDMWEGLALGWKYLTHVVTTVPADGLTSTDTKILSGWPKLGRLLQIKLSKWQLLVKVAIKRLSKYWHFHLGAVRLFSVGNQTSVGTKTTTTTTMTIQIHDRHLTG